LKRYLNWLSISLQFIRSTRRLSGLSSATVLRLMALKRDRPELFFHQELSFALSERIDTERYNPGGAEDEFQQYLERFTPSDVEAFERLLTESPLLASTVTPLHEHWGTRRAPVAYYPDYPASELKLDLPREAPDKRADTSEFPAELAE
jgi:hypothetical protein